VIETGFFRNRPKSWIRHIMITFFIIATATAVSMATDSLGLVVELVGCFSASPLGMYASTLLPLSGSVNI